MVDQPAPASATGTTGRLFGIGLIVAVIIAIVVATISAVICHWPDGDTSSATMNDIIVIVCAMGALGATIQMSGALAYHVGMGTFQPRWLVWYALRPAIGAGLALIVYFATVGGVAGGSHTNLNLIGIAGLAGVTGLFTRAAMDSLRDAFGGQSDRPGGERRLEIHGTEPETLTLNRPNQSLTIKGKGFGSKPKVSLDGMEIAPSSAKDDEIKLVVPDALVAKPHKLKIEVGSGSATKAAEIEVV